MTKTAPATQPIEDTPVFTLTSEEKAIIRRFVTVLTDVGVQANLVVNISDGFTSSKATVEALAEAMQDVRRTCGFQMEGGVVAAPEAIPEAAPSLALVVDVAQYLAGSSLFQFPANFLPGKELVDKCLAEFFRQVEAHVATQG